MNLASIGKALTVINEDNSNLGARYTLAINGRVAFYDSEMNTWGAREGTSEECSEEIENYSLALTEDTDLPPLPNPYFYHSE